MTATIVDPAALKRANKRLRRELTNLHEDINTRVRAAQRDVGVSCTKGCHACCRQMVLVELAEAALILYRHAGVVQRVLPKLVAHAHSVVGLGRALSIHSDRNAVGEMCDAYWELDLPCAFLERGLCSVYESRPIACRTHFVVSDPERCAHNEDVGVVVVDLGGSRSAVQLRAVVQIVSARDGEFLMGTLPQMMIEAAKLAGDSAALLDQRGGS